MHKKAVKSSISILIVIIFVLSVGWYASRYWHEFNSLSVTNPLFIIPSIVFIVINIFGAGTLFDLTVEPHGVKLTKSEAFGLANITRFSNQLSPSYVGATIRATYLKRVHQVSYAKFSSSFLVSNLLQFMLSGMFTIALFFTLTPSVDDATPLIIIGAVVAIFIALLYAPVNPLVALAKKMEDRRSGPSKKIFERLGVLLASYTTVRKHPNLLPNMIIWMLVTILSSGAIYFLVYQALGVQIDIVGALFISALTNWSIILSITPGNIGIREGLMILAAQIAGVSIAATLLTALLIRLLVFIVSGLLSLYYSSRLLSTSIFSFTKK